MGVCISPVKANILLDHFERMVSEQCPIIFKPSFYKRYLDDTFLVFECEE